MLPFRRMRQPTHPVVLVLGQIRDDLASIGRALKALPSIRDDLTHVHRHLHTLKEEIMANFDALNQRLDTLTASLDDAKQRIADDFQALKDQLANDAADQAAVDAAVARLDESIASLDSVDPDPNSPAVPAPVEGEQPQ